MGNSRTKNTLLNAMGNILVKIVSIVTAFVTRTIFIRMLGIQYAGVSGVFTDVLTMLSLAELGIGTAITYALYKPIAEGDRRQIGKLMSAYKTIYSTIAAVIFTAGLVLLPFLKYIIKDVPDIVEDIRLIYLLYLTNSAASYLLIYKSTFLIAAQKEYLVSKIKVCVAIAKAIGECVLLLLFRDFIIYLVFAIVVNLTQNILVAKIAEREYPIIKEKSQEKLSREEKKKLFGDVKALALYKISGTVLSGTDSIVTSSILGTSLVGVLGNYNLIANNVYSFVMQFFSATSASIGNLAATSSSEHQYVVFRRMLFLCFWIYCFCATCLWVLFNPFMVLWQEGKYLFSPIVVALLITDFYLKGMLSPITQFRTSNGLFVQGKYRPVIMAAINVSVSIILAKQIGIAGIILGTIISRATTQLWYDPWLIYREVFQRRVSEYYFIYVSYILLTVFCCAVTQKMFTLLCSGTGLLSILLGLMLCMVIPNAVIVLLFHKTEEFKSVIQVLIRIMKRKL